MKTEVAHCSGCGHKVRLVFTDPPPHDGQANLREDAEIVCLDYKEGCTAGKCPATGKPGHAVNRGICGPSRNTGSVERPDSIAAASMTKASPDLVTEVKFPACKYNHLRFWKQMNSGRAFGAASTSFR